MQTKPAKLKYGFSIVEVVVASAALLVLIVGSSAYRYYSMFDQRKALVLSSAARIGLFLCEAWRGENGDINFDPVGYASSDMTISDGEGPIKPTDFTLLGSYTVTLADVEYKATLS